MASGAVISGNTSSGSTLSTKSAVASLPAASTVVKVTVVPRANGKISGALLLTSTAPSTISVAVTLTSQSCTWVSAKARSSPAEPSMVLSAPEISGAVVSSTVTVTVLALSLPAASVTVIDTTVSPKGIGSGKVEVMATLRSLPSTLSEASAAAVMASLAPLYPPETVASRSTAEGVTTGESWSVTDSVSWPVAILPDASVTVTSSKVSPNGKNAGKAWPSTVGTTLSDKSPSTRSVAPIVSPNASTKASSDAMPSALAAAKVTSTTPDNMGTVVSTTIMVTCPVPTLPLESVTERSTTVVPSTKEAGSDKTSPSTE